MRFYRGSHKWPDLTLVLILNRTIVWPNKQSGRETIPPKCSRPMRMNKGRELSICDDWENFIMRHDCLELPTGQRVTAQQVLIGVALLELGASNDSELAHQILKYARVLKNIV